MKIFNRDDKANDPYEGIECGDKVRDIITDMPRHVRGDIVDTFNFGVVDLLRYPGDTGVRSEEIIKFRCVVGYVPPLPRQGPR